MDTNAKENNSNQSLLCQLEKIKNECQDAFDCIKQMLIVIDISDKIMRCNRIFKDFLNLPYEKIIGQDFYKLLNGLGLNISNLPANEDMEVYYERSNIWFNFHITPFRSHLTNSISGAVILIDDITDIKDLTESLLLTNEKIDKERIELQSTLDDISFIIQEVEQKGDLGIRFSLPDDSSNFIYKIGTSFNKMMEILQAQHTELENAYSELKKAQAQILQREKMASIGQIAAGVAHEINNPIGFVSSNLSSLSKYVSKLLEYIKEQGDIISLMQESCDKNIATTCMDKLKEASKRLKIEYVKEDIYNLIQESLSGTERVSKIVNNLKSFSRIDEVEWKMANLNSCIDNTLNIIWNELKYKVEIKKEYGDIPNIFCNPAELNQVFMNIILNASQAIDTKGIITIKTWTDEKSVYISIQDNGCGIEEEKIPKIFEPFFTTKEVGKGTGLGLSISYDIIKKHDGDISVTSKIKEGSTFVIRLPIKEHK
ncbi:MAG: ATP-binding protein [Thermodesulfovibrionales bacterium]|nr:ATP-binding protein [Thermodesulfovibrionales bacterium]